MPQAHRIFPPIDRTWTLFLDRDGVLNRRLPEDYVKGWGEWEWIPGVLEALPNLARRFGTICIVTNQRGIARKLMTEQDLTDIHAAMVVDIMAAGGRIDAIFHCPHDKHAGCDCRKPGIGMYLQALERFPGIDPRKSILVGDSESDMVMARDAGVYAVYVGEAAPAGMEEAITMVVPSLKAFADAL